MTRNLALGLILLFTFDTGFVCSPRDRFANTPPAVVEIQEAQEDWRIEMPREAMAQSFSTLTNVKFETALEIVLIVERETNKYGLDPFRILGFIVAESNGKIRAYSSAGARGLMQIMPATGKFIAHSLGEKWRGTKSLYEMETNIVYGIWYYKHLLDFFAEDEHAAMSAYNWGPEHIRFRLKKGRRLPVVYPDKVLKAQEKLEREFSHEGTKRFWEHFSGYVDPPSAQRYANGPIGAASDPSLPLDVGEGP